MKHYTFVDYATQVYATLVALTILCFHNATVAHWGWLVGAHVAGIAAVHFLVEARARGWGGRAVDFLRHFYPVFLYAWFFGETGWINRMFFHEYLDRVVIGWDQALFGFQPSVMFMEKLPYLAVSELFYASYFSYYVMIAGIGLALYLRNREQFFHYVSVVSFVFYVCYALYIVLPVIGPPIFFRSLPDYRLPDALQQLAPVAGYPEAVKGGFFFTLMAWIYRVFEAPGAAIPSSHVAIAIVTVFFSFRYLRRIRFIHLTVAVLLCLATVYCRYHYAMDVVAGALTAGVLIPVGNRLFKRFGPQQSSPKAASDKSDTACTPCRQ